MGPPSRPVVDKQTRSSTQGTEPGGGGYSEAIRIRATHVVASTLYDNNCHLNVKRQLLLK